MAKRQKSMRGAVKRLWPSELRQPILTDWIEKQIDKLEPNASKSRDELLYQVMDEELTRRVAIMARLFGLQWPLGERDLLRFVLLLCLLWDIPGLDLADRVGRGAGATKKWDAVKNRQLLADVMSLNKRGMSENAACRYIAHNPEKFLNRYSKNHKTLHRQFLRAKKEFGQLL